MQFFKTVGLIFVLFLFQIQAAEITLVRNGKPEAVILLNRESTKSAQLGAFELQYHIEKITGANLPIVTEPQKGKIAIRIGGDNAGLQGDAHRIRVGEDFILLTGSDTQDFRNVDYANVSTFPLAFQFCNGSLFAVYDFLENCCGVRFLYFDDKSTVVRPRKTLTVNVKDKDFESSMDAFRWIYFEDKFRRTLSGRDYELNKLRWRMCCLYGRTNHNQYSIYFKHWAPAKSKKLAPAFTEKREALFAQGFRGKAHSVDQILQVNYPDDPDIPPQLCYSNPDTIHYYADEVLTYAKGQNVLGGWGNPYGDYPVTKNVLPRISGKPYFYPIQGGDTGGHCLCPNCKKRFPNDNPDNVSNNKFQFIADVAREVAKTDPTAGVSTLAYIQTLGYPDHVILPPNVSVQLCLFINSWWHPIAYKKQFDEYKKWVAKEGKKRPLTLWTYLYGAYFDARYTYGNYKPFPHLYPWKTGEFFKIFAADGMRGYFSEVDPVHNALEAYVAAKIGYDSSLNPVELIDDYFNYAFGDAAPYVKEFYKEIENASWHPEIPKELLKDSNVLRAPNGPRHPFWSSGLWNPELSWSLGTPERMKKLADLIKEAGKRVKTDTEKQYYGRILKLWQEAEQGRQEFDRMQKLKNIPGRSMAIHQSADLNGDFNKVDWNSAPVTEKWGLLMGQASDSLCTVRAAADSQWLYLEFRDPKGADINWYRQDDFEIFMSENRGFPVYQLCISPKGSIGQLKYTKKEDKVTHSEYDFQLKSYNRIENGTWVVRLAVPRNKLPFQDNMLNINFFRTEKSGHGTFKAWNPIFTGQYLDGVDRAGSLMIFPLTIQEKAFYLHKNGQLSGKGPDSAADNGTSAWMQADASWAIQYVAKDSFHAGKYQISVRMRSKITDPGNVYNSLGIYDRKNKKVLVSKKITANESAGNEFKTFDLGVCEFGPDMSFYVGGFSNKDSQAMIFIDSIKFTIPEQK